MNKDKYLRGLNGLRAIAVSLVFFRHAFYLYSNNISLPNTGFNSFFLNGWIGVDLFFVLSGFLISRSFFQNKESVKSLKTYALQRFLRIFPAYFCVLALILLGFFPYYQISLESIWYRIYYHVFFLQDYFSPDINPVFWSLGVEEKFYFIMPLLFFFLQKIKKDKTKVSILIFFIFISLFFRFFSYELTIVDNNYYSFFRSTRAPFHNCLDPLFLGVLIAYLEHKKWYFIPAKTTFWLGLLGFILFSASHEFLAEINHFDAILQPFIISLFFAAIVYGVVFGVELKILENKLTDYLSKISYSLYLVHWPLFFLSHEVTTRLKLSNNIETFFVFLIIYAFISLFFSTILFQAIERPCLKLKEKLLLT